MVKNMIAYGGGILAFVVVLLLLRLVCKELFRKTEVRGAAAEWHK